MNGTLHTMNGTLHHTLHHEVVEITTLDGTQMCKLNSPFFDKSDVIEMVKRLLEYSENFIVVGYNEGRREEALKEAVEFYRMMEEKNPNWKMKNDISPTETR